MSQTSVTSYFHRRARRFSRFYRSEAITRLVGRGPLFDRLRFAVDTAVSLDAARVLDVGCGSGPLFGPLAERGIHVTGIDPADSMVALAREQAAGLRDFVGVEQRGWEELEEKDAYELAVVLGLFDYVESAGDLLGRVSRAAPHVVASFPGPGMRLNLRKLRYGIHGVKVHGYGPSDLDRLAGSCGMEIIERRELGRGNVVHFARLG